ncbi:MAG: hypothetical protein ABMA15_24380 [Vicinamibacterales bacterium]
MSSFLAPRNRFAVGCVLTAGMLLCSRMAGAQSNQTEATPDQRETPGKAKWEFGVHAGISRDSNQSNGTSILPTTGTTAQGLLSVSTFYFGSGAALFNQVQPATPIVALDPVLTKPSVARTSGVSLGGHIQRSFGDRFALEVTGDYLRSSLAFTPAALNQIEATRASFTSALQAALASTSETASVTSVASITEKQLATRVALTGAMLTDLRQTGRVIPYVLVGAGVIFNQPNALAASLAGRYQFGSSSYIVGTDTVALSYVESKRQLVIVAGGGVKQMLSPRTGLRMDARVQAYKNTLASIVSVTPGRSLESTGPTLPVVSTNGIQFSSTGPLNGSSSTGTTLAGSGIRTHVTVTAGFFVRF